MIRPFISVGDDPASGQTPGDWPRPGDYLQGWVPNDNPYGGGGNTWQPHGPIQQLMRSAATPEIYSLFRDPTIGPSFSGHNVEFNRLIQAARQGKLLDFFNSPQGKSMRNLMAAYQTFAPNTALTGYAAGAPGLSIKQHDDVVNSLAALNQVQQDFAPVRAAREAAMAAKGNQQAFQQAMQFYRQTRKSAMRNERKQVTSSGG